MVSRTEAVSMSVLRMIHTATLVLLAGTIASGDAQRDQQEQKPNQGYYIPADRFRLYFGSQHWFRIQSRPIIVGGYPRFRYGDYWFMLVDPWPEYWADNWYALDDVYVDYNNGYYLYNRRYPGVGMRPALCFEGGHG